ncbi:nicotinamide mononucleotide transporter [Mycolicibacterium sp. BK634]|uniref:nicotinamide riboside transporter PnuC n=1 Tax=Mycolicibacterium sp. BK634 TaxID=2587099 RepID=UPI001858BA2E|nr:nicotinamide riboside transporter PnuC [Mycolicibacterium sp. BK634]MBB3752412.1 nicotinamide mononucleotide transporter [Mycolicibacterium sp. BK634]
MRRYFIESVGVAMLATGASYIIAYLAGWITAVNWLEVFAVWTSYACTWLCVRQSRWNYPIGAISTAAYAVLFWQADLLASALLNAYLTPALLYGWFRWRQDSETRPVTRVAWKWWPAYIGVTAAAYYGAIWLVTTLKGSFSITDALILIGSMLAQFLLDNKKIETWAVWAIVNVAAIYTYFHASLPLAGFQYILFLANTGVGYVVWRRSVQSVRAHESYAADHGSSAAHPVR